MVFLQTLIPITPDIPEIKTVCVLAQCFGIGRCFGCTRRRTGVFFGLVHGSRVWCTVPDPLYMVYVQSRAELSSMELS